MGKKVSRGKYEKKLQNLCTRNCQILTVALNPRAAVFRDDRGQQVTNRCQTHQHTVTRISRRSETPLQVIGETCKAQEWGGLPVRSHCSRIVGAALPGAMCWDVGVASEMLVNAANTRTHWLSDREPPPEVSQCHLCGHPGGRPVYRRHFQTEQAGKYSPPATFLLVCL